MYLLGNKLTYLSALDYYSLLWHKHLGLASLSLLNILVIKDQVLGLPKSRFKKDKVCGAGAKGKHVKSSFKSNKVVSTSGILELLHMNLCGPIRVQSKGGKRYMFTIINDYSRYT